MSGQVIEARQVSTVTVLPLLNGLVSKPPEIPIQSAGGGLDAVEVRPACFVPKPEVWAFRGSAYKSAA